MSVTGINNSQTQFCHVVSVRIKSIHTSFTKEIECYVLSKITENLPQTYISIRESKPYQVGGPVVLHSE